MKNPKPFGSWKSPVSPEFVSGKDRMLSAAIQTDGDSLYFLEARPDEAGRSVLMRLEQNGTPTEVLPSEYNVRTRYLEYSGMCFLVEKGTCYFVHFADQEIYVAESGQAPRKLTNEKGNRFADFSLDAKRNRLIALREVPAQPESRNTICAIDLKSGKVEDLVSGADFYNSARVQGDQLLWISWNHPNMPWNGTELYTASFDNLKAPRKIAGDAEHSIAQARWTTNHTITFAAELTNYNNLYRFENGITTNLLPRDGEFVYPDWVPGSHQYDESPDGTLCAAFLKEGRWQIVLRDPAGRERTVQAKFSSVDAIHRHQDHFVAFVSHDDRPVALVTISKDGTLKELYAPKQTTLDPGYISVAEEIRYPTTDGGTGFAWFYAPKSADHTGNPGEKPPLVVFAHGGPTAMSPPAYRKGYQFWTTRGYAVVDVNYGGSSGYGRAYRERLRGNWGLVDVQDCAAAVKMLAASGKIDPKRVAIRGGSAGGYTTLAALAFTKNIFSVGASYFGVSDLELLAKETHKLESRYLDQLVGPYPAALELYKERAPRAHLDKFSCPIIFFQGDEDKVVPPNQSELMHEELKRKGIRTEYHLYAKEGHGFRRAENNQHSLKAEHSFYAKVFGFEVQAGDGV